MGRTEYKILSNQVRCNACGDEPYSAHTHDFRQCKCGNVAVDGGMSYLRRVGGERGVTPMSITMDKGIVADVLRGFYGVDTGRDSEEESERLGYLVVDALSKHAAYSSLSRENLSTECREKMVAEIDQARQRLGGVNALGVLCAVARVLRDNGFFEVFTNPYKVGGKDE